LDFVNGHFSRSEKLARFAADECKGAFSVAVAIDFGFVQAVIRESYNALYV
jgi:hypothetical protein